MVRPTAAALKARFTGAEAGVLAAILLAQGAFLWHFAGPSFFAADDYINLQQAADAGGLTIHYLLAPAISHFAPGHRAANYFRSAHRP